MQRHHQTWLFSALLLSGCLLSFPSALDSKSKGYIDQSLNSSLQSFALARSLNAVISTAQGTEISVEPFGLGVTLTPGQFLDPVNDLIERFSWIMLASSTSIGIQKLLLEICSDKTTRLFLLIVFLATLAVIWIPGLPDPVRRFSVRFSLLLILFRVSVPMIFLANEFVYSHFLAQQYQQSTRAIRHGEIEIDRLTNAMMETEKSVPDSPPDTFMEKLSSTFRFEENYSAFKAKISRYEKQMTELAGNIATAIVELIAVFFLQAILFPLAFLFGLYKLIPTVSRIPVFQTFELKERRGGPS